MRILITNDDGIHAEGIAVLERIARTLSDDIWVIAPETDQSGLAHSLTLSEPLRLRKIDDRHIDFSKMVDLSKIANTAQNPFNNTRRTASTFTKTQRSLRSDWNFKETGILHHNCSTF